MFHFESWVFFLLGGGGGGGVIPCFLSIFKVGGGGGGGGGGLNETQVDSQGLPPPFLHTASIKNWCRSSGKKQLGEAEYTKHESFETLTPSSLLMVNIWLVNCWVNLNFCAKWGGSISVGELLHSWYR